MVPKFLVIIQEMSKRFEGLNFYLLKGKGTHRKIRTLLKGPLNQRSFHPAQFNNVDAAEVAHPEFILLVSNEDVLWSRIERPIFPEVGGALKLKQAGSHSIKCHRIIPDEKAFVFGDEPSIKVMGSPVIELGAD